VIAGHPRTLRAETRVDTLVATMPDQVVTAPRVSATLPRVEELWLTTDYQDRWRELLACLNPRSGEKVLDVGFGRGEALRYLAPRLGQFGRAVGVGPAAAHAAGLRGQTTAEPVPPVAVAGVAQALPFHAGAFDAALCVNVLEALPATERQGATRSGAGTVAACAACRRGPR
jgi:SAM-dependent methyltransferase